MIAVKRFLNEPIIYPHMDDRMGDNINGPSLIRAPNWLKKPLGLYYLCLLYTSPSPRDGLLSRMPSSA